MYKLFFFYIFFYRQDNDYLGLTIFFNYDNNLEDN